jgi:hypothetical protein
MHNPNAKCTTTYVGDPAGDLTLAQKRDLQLRGQKAQRTVVINWGEVKDQVKAVVERGEQWDSQPSGSRLRFLYDSPTQKESWGRHPVYDTDSFGRPKYTRQGRRQFHYEEEFLGSGADIAEWFRNGFRSEEFENLADRVPTALRSAPSWSDEDGDVDVGRMAGGWDDFYIGLGERPSKPGVRMQIEMAFAAGVKQKTIEQYAGWVNSLLGSMEAYGIDMVIDLWIPLDNLFIGDAMRTNVLIRVKHANEVSDFTDWSILFSPAGYRQIGFAAKCVAGDKIGKRVIDHYGVTIGGKTWGLQYDRENSVVSITCNQRAGGNEEIPFDSLTKQAIEAGLIPDPEKVQA